ncbi:hypothetical protein [Cryobacterium sp. AP23]
MGYNTDEAVAKILKAYRAAERGRIFRTASRVLGIAIAVLGGVILFVFGEQVRMALGWNDQRATFFGFAEGLVLLIVGWSVFNAVQLTARFVGQLANPFYVAADELRILGIDLTKFTRKERFGISRPSSHQLKELARRLRRAESGLRQGWRFGRTHQTRSAREIDRAWRHRAGHQLGLAELCLARQNIGGFMEALNLVRTVEVLTLLRDWSYSGQSLPGIAIQPSRRIFDMLVKGLVNVITFTITVTTFVLPFITAK